MKKVLFLLLVCAVLVIPTSATITQTNFTDGNYTWIKFNGTGNTTWTVPYNVTNLSYLVVGGGGGGGNGVNAHNNGGGGGAGGFLNATSYTVVPNSIINITVGSGGSGGVNGTNSSFNDTIIAIGGGAGGGLYPGVAGKNGGSGGGAGPNNVPNSPGNGTAGQGNNGGVANPASPFFGGGGGGAGSAGVSGVSRGNGGSGLASSITGTSLYYAGGGGGGGDEGAASPGGSSIGGTGAVAYGSSATNAVAERGSGGGGGVSATAQATGGSGSNGIVIIRYLTPLTANFTSINGSSTNPASVLVNDTSTGGPTEWNWNFGDSTSNITTKNATHIYSTAGNYTVTLTVTSTQGNTTTSKNVTAGQINWSGTPTSGAAPLTVQFNDSSWSNTSTAMSTWNWTFGDGQFSTNRNVTHVYTSAGTYNVTLNVTWSGGSNSTTQTNYITASNVAPTANFYGDQTWGSAPLTVNFYDISTGGTATSWAWQWGDGEANGTTQNPSHVYASNGNYTVNMTATNAVGNTTKQRVGYILVGTTGGGGGGTLDAIFRSNVTSGTYPLSVQFTDLSTGGPSTWNWSFGDGDPNSTSTSPAHTYATAGSYTVILTVTNATATPSSATTSVSAFIVVANTGSPQANFYSDTTWGINYVNASFHDISSGGNATSWNWSFGDGTYNTTQNPVHNYTTLGTYTVILNATNAEGSTTKTRTDYIQVSDGKPTVSFYGAPTNGTYPLTVSFHDTSGNTPTSWQWDFGDSTANATTQNPNHQYTAAGTYDVTLTATNAYGSNSHKTTAYIGVTSPPAPVASFYGTPTSGTVSFDVTFTDTSTGSPTSWQWDFGDSTSNATTQNPTHSYSVAGTYTVTLTSTNAYGNSTYQFPNMITAAASGGSAPTANFTATPRTGSAPQSVTFTDTSIGEARTAYYWQFGDGYTSTDANPTHIYLNNGLYTVNFRATGVDGSDWENKTNWINLTAPAPSGIPSCAFTSNVTGGSTYPCSVQFYQQCTGGPTSYNWSFGDGNTSTDANPNHTYTSQGYFTVTLNATNSFGTGEVSTGNYIHITQHYTRVVATGTITPISTRGYNAILDSIGGNRTPANATAAKVNFTEMLLGTTYPYTDVVGSLVLVIIFAIPFVLMWLMQRDLTLPGVVGIIVGAFLFIYIPSEWHLAPIAFIGMSIAAIIYGIMTRRE